MSPICPPRQSSRLCLFSFRDHCQSSAQWRPCYEQSTAWITFYFNQRSYFDKQWDRGRPHGFPIASILLLIPHLMATKSLPSLRLPKEFSSSIASPRTPRTNRNSIFHSSHSPRNPLNDSDPIDDLIRRKGNHWFIVDEIARAPR